MLEMINSFHRDESGATMVEYGLLVALIALVVGLGAQIVCWTRCAVPPQIGARSRAFCPSGAAQGGEGARHGESKRPGSAASAPRVDDLVEGRGGFA